MKLSLFQYSPWASVFVGVLLTVGLLVVGFWPQYQQIVGGHLIAINGYQTKLALFVGVVAIALVFLLVQ